MFGGSVMFGGSLTNLKSYFRGLDDSFSAIAGHCTIMVTVFKIRPIDEIMDRPVVDIYDSDYEDDESSSSSDSPRFNGFYIEKPL
jgi:hypothetical protein